MYAVDLWVSIAVSMKAVVELRWEEMVNGNNTLLLVKEGVGLPFPPFPDLVVGTLEYGDDQTEHDFAIATVRLEGGLVICDLAAVYLDELDPASVKHVVYSLLDQGWKLSPGDTGDGDDDEEECDPSPAPSDSQEVVAR